METRSTLPALFMVLLVFVVAISPRASAQVLQVVPTPFLNADTPMSPRTGDFENGSVYTNKSHSRDIDAEVRTLSVSPATLNQEQDELEVNFTLDHEAQVTIELVAIGGKATYAPVYQRYYPAGDQNEQIDVSALPNGDYALRISTPDGSSQQRIALEK